MYKVDVTNSKISGSVNVKTSSLTNVHYTNTCSSNSISCSDRTQYLNLISANIVCSKVLVDFNVGPVNLSHKLYYVDRFNIIRQDSLVEACPTERSY